MKIEHIAPEGLLPSKHLGYSQVIKTDARTTVYIAGQGAVDKEMKEHGMVQVLLSFHGNKGYRILEPEE